MKFTCESYPMAYAVEKCARMVSYKENYPSARSILIVAENGKISLSVTDVISGAVTYYVSDTVEIRKEGRMSVDANTLKVFVSAVSGNLSFEITRAGRLMVRCGSKKISLAKSEEPELPTMRDSAIHVASVSGSILKSVFSISFMSAQEDQALSIEALKGTLLMFDGEKIYSMAASHGSAAYTWHSQVASGKGKFNLPRQAVDVLNHYLYDDDTVEVHLDGKKLWFNAGRFIMYTVQVNAKFPYDAVSNMVSNPRPYSLSVDNDELSEILNTVFKFSRVTSQKLARISFHSDPEYRLLTVRTDESNEIGSLDWSVMTKETTGESIEFVLSSKYLENIVVALSKLKTTDLLYEVRGLDYVTISVGKQEDNLGPIYFSSPNMQAIFVIAPMGFPTVEEVG